MKKLLLFITLITIVSSCHKVDFDIKGEKTFNKLKNLSSLSMKLNSVTGLVWKEAIYNKKYSLCESPNVYDCYVSDPDSAMLKFSKEKKVILLRDRISKMQKNINLSLDSIDKPFNSDSEVYENLVDLNNNINELSNEARNPTGSFTSFIKKSNELDYEIRILIIKIESEKPKWKN